MAQRKKFTTWGYGLLAAIVVGFAVVAGTMPSNASPHASGATVRYPTGWNLVALPTAQLLDQATPPLYAFGPGSTSYQPIGLGDAIGGRAVWAYFAHDVTITLEPTASEYTRVLARPDQWTLVGDPSTSQSERITGADAAIVYDAVQGYTSVDELHPGQGAWVLRHDSGAIFLGTAPTTSGESTVQTAQGTLTSNPTDQATFDTVASTTGEMVRSRQYSAVQSASDDLRAADDDGLRSQGSATLPPLDETQRASADTVRADVAKAKTANDAGDTVTADAAISDARVAAQAAQDDASTQAQATAASTSVVYAVAGATPASLVRFGLLARAGFLGLSLGVPLSPYYRNLQMAVLNNTPLPPAPNRPPTQSQAPTVTSVTCTPASIVAGSSTNCSAEIHGTVTAVTWSAPGSLTPMGTGVTYGTEFDTAGSFTVTVQACNGGACTSLSQKITVTGGSVITPPTTTHGPVTVSGTFVLNQQDGPTSCSYSRSPQTGGTITINGSFAASGSGSASGMLQGGGSGSRQVTCGGIFATMDWMQQYSAQFSGTIDPSTGAVSLSGTVSGSQNISYRNCIGSDGFTYLSTPVSGSCPSDSQAPTYSFPIIVTGTVSLGGGSSSGTITVTNISLQTSGTWAAH